jgi:hypothetical protein
MLRVIYTKLVIRPAPYVFPDVVQYQKERNKPEEKREEPTRAGALFIGAVRFSEYNFCGCAGVLVDKPHALLNRLEWAIEGER